MNPVVLSYNNCVLRRHDLELLEPQRWLNDSLLAFAFEYLELGEFAGLPTAGKVCFIGPEVAHFIKLSTVDEIGVFLEPLDLMQKDVVMLAISDHTTPNTVGGMHWSLLLYDRSKDIFQHFDSCHGSSNNSQARITARKLEPFLGRQAMTRPAFIESRGAPQQENGHDCGVYVLCNARHLAQRFLLGRDGPPLKEIVTPAYVTQQRQELRQLIERLAKQSRVANG